MPPNTSCPGPGGVRASCAGRSCDFAVGSINAAAYDREGDVNGVVFPCGWILDKTSGEIRIYYGGADTCLALATAQLSDVLSYLSKCPEPPARKRTGMTLFD